MNDKSKDLKDFYEWFIAMKSLAKTDIINELECRLGIEVRKGSRLRKIPEPVGSFILAQEDIQHIDSPNGYLYHYSDVCVLLNRFRTSHEVENNVKLTDKLKTKFIDHLTNKYNDLDIPYIVMNSEVFTVREIIDHLINESEEGIKLINNMISLSINLFESKKERLSEIHHPEDSKSIKVSRIVDKYLPQLYINGSDEYYKREKKRSEMHNEIMNLNH